MTIEGKILIVDDQEDNLRVLYHYLRHRGYRIYVATNGETGLNLAVIRCPDLILLDIVMPGMDGFATCECLKSRQETRDIPVIFLSALADRESKLKGLRTGAVDYINKPFEIEEVLARVATHINLHCLQGRLREQNQLLKQQSRMLEEQASVARQVSQAKSSLMAVATHDLRQPLHALNLLVETLESRTDNPRLRKLIGKIQYSITAVSDSFSTMQDIIRLDANKIVPEKGVVDLGSLSKQLCREFKEQAEEKGLLFTIDACEIHGQSDAVLLKRILHNLLSNAICYTDVGKVSMHCRSSAEEIQISVSDTGAGIAKEQQAHIFEEFYQTDTKNRNNEGIGLGLSIVKRLAALLSHPLSFDSHPGQGSTFIISIPPAASSSREIKESPAAWEWEEDAFIPGGYIVVMDSDPVTREVTVELLEDWGYEVLPADNPETVLQQLAASEKIPELIISGYNLQEKYTGIQAIQAVQQRLSKDVPAIIITAEMSTQNVSDMKQSGYPILLKPVRPDYLYEMIKKHLSRSVEQLV